MKKYEQILNLPHHVSATRPRMSVAERAAQFSPFAALTGLDAQIKETGRLTWERAQTDTQFQEKLDEKLRLAMEVVDTEPEIRVIYFRPDARKAGGAYVTRTGRLKRIDTYARTLIFTDKTAIAIDDLYDIDGEIFGR